MKTFTAGIELNGENFRFQFECPSRGVYVMPRFWGCEVRMEKDDHALGWDSQWFVEIYLNLGNRWVAVNTFQPTRAHCLEWLASVALSLRNGEAVWFDHTARVNADGSKYAWAKLPERNRVAYKWTDLIRRVAV